MSKGQREMTREELKHAYMKKMQRVWKLEKDIKEWKIVNESWEEINTQID